MKELTDKCKKCLGCNKLELETFRGKYRCEDFISGEKYEQIQKQKNNNRWNTI